MNVNELDFENIGSWPALFKGIFLVIIAGLIVGGFYYFMFSDQLKTLEQAQHKEVEIKRQFEAKAALASNLEAYRKQMVEIEGLLAELVKKLPSKSEVSTLLDNVNFIGSDNGLQFKRFKPSAEIEREFSVEVPYGIEMIGTYDQIGQFSADIAKLPRIIILDNINIKKIDNETLNVELTAKTYTYKEAKK
ncbi:type 4a pilus biogenesis protein PilO [Motilimonas sp. 1_MG-2023]|uniref:type 4a pilus biogenesis protein PilO n=1 Tax=Motilimonas sp. 1_MG-2023 TaxID=3062672 RepID=UPI0026E4176B|nr:type 4a pilus biogenesis protein PilO [Motilimonas sp. 1_MG-2023]MDO6524427.1 type 4a pilus biogenesis protein PilO [Motilimonas sp. 1_MG-2023]